jgi:hypothetical protein
VRLARRAQRAQAPARFPTNVSAETSELTGGTSTGLHEADSAGTSAREWRGTLQVPGARRSMPRDDTGTSVCGDQGRAAGTSDSVTGSELDLHPAHHGHRISASMLPRCSRLLPPTNTRADGIAGFSSLRELAATVTKHGHISFEG